MAISLPFSVFTTSVAQFILVLNWLIQFNYKYKWNRFKQAKSLWVFLVLVIVHLLALFYTNDFSYAASDLRIKLPLLALPIIVATTKPLEFKHIKFILLLFAGAVLINTLIGLAVFISDRGATENIRDISLFVSHIRLSLMINLSIFSLFYFMQSKQLPQKWEYFLYPALIVWFVAYLVILQAFTGFVVFVLVFIGIMAAKLITSKNKKVKYISIVTIVSALLVLIISITKSINDFYPKSYPVMEQLPRQTNQGNRYYHDYRSKLIENGNLIYANICEKELRQTWPQVSSLSIDSLDGHGQPVMQTLIRYLSSVDLTKDAEGVLSLTPIDVRAIEDGKANIRFRDGFGFGDRVYQLIWQFDVYFKGGNPSGHSVTQRLEYLKTGFYILGNNFWLGVGTGDVDQAFKETYRTMPTLLAEEFQHRTHNQFLTFFITFGVFGGMAVLAAVFYPVLMEEAYKKYLFNVFFAIALLSMLADDTLETAAGSAFFALFFALFLWGIKKKEHES
jgi:hypothetical protein